MADVADRHSLDALDARLKILLPEEYRDYEAVKPVSMGSAGLKYGNDGLVAWDRIWGSFCDLAMAGGPPHKGTLLGPGREADIDAQFDRYDEVVEEICRGITMVTGLRAYPAETPGWVCVTCHTEAMAGWLLRAIVMENVAARARGMVLELPAAPHFRLEKEIKNVITVIAKTCHYWLGHMPAGQQQAVGGLLAAMNRESPLIEPGAWEPDGWTPVECGSVRAAVSMMRALVTRNVLSRREGTTLFVPVNATSDPGGTIVAAALAHVRRCLKPEA